jgi:hypothetical protein
MSRRITIGAVAAALLVAIPAIALAATTVRKTHTVTATLKQASIAATGTPPQAGSTDTEAGSVKSNIASGAEIATITWGNAGAFTGTGTLFSAKGTVKIKNSGTLSVSGNNLVTSGKGTVVGGTGAYKGATGKFTFTGSRPVNGTVSTVQITGKVKY